MNIKTKSWIYSLPIIGLLLIFASCSKKTDSNSNPSPLPIPTAVTDIDGNIYHTITIGTQVWLIENLKTTKLNDGTLIQIVTNSSAWNNLTTPGYCWYNNDSHTYKTAYGALYNWHAVNSGKLAPAGWHVPTNAELTTLTTYLGGEEIAGGKMKSTGTIESGTGIWHSPNTDATNESGFTAIPAGSRSTTGLYGTSGSSGSFWSSSEDGTYNALCRTLSWFSRSVHRTGEDKNNGYSVRCIRN
ncbi:MAG: FISUMP domain-containing protein [Bacteroidales bacterium]